jgi:hypothetical protein
VQLRGVSLRQAPSPASSVLAAELLPLGRIATRRGPIAHHRQFRRREQLELPHAIIVPHPAAATHYSIIAKERSRSQEITRWSSIEFGRTPQCESIFDSVPWH